MKLLSPWEAALSDQAVGTKHVITFAAVLLRLKLNPPALCHYVTKTIDFSKYCYIKKIMIQISESKAVKEDGQEILKG